jgi:uncharacterized membrane protein
MRQITLLHSVISFVFNLAILGLSVNVGGVAGLNAASLFPFSFASVLPVARIAQPR